MAAAFLAVACLGCGACTSFQHPIVDEHGAGLDQELIGTWSGENEHGSLRVEITRDGNEGRLVMTSAEPGRPPETSHGRLVTVQLDRYTYASFQDGDDAGTSWILLRYELHGSDRLSIYFDNNRFWDDAIRNKTVTGEINDKGMIRSVTVTATSEELRQVVLGYGSVIFNDTPDGELTRE